ncbi:MAG: endolytic transglycosylase MltG [Patescibacteria group bacterium]|mgnify:CR=1 FL=1
MHRLRIVQVIGGVLLALFLVVGFELGVIFPPTPHQSVVRIDRGMNTEEIGVRLKEAGVVRSRVFFVWAAYFSGIQNRLGAGSFEFSGARSTFSVLRALLSQREQTLLVTEGSTVADIAKTLQASGMPAGVRFEAVARPQEGFLFPDTYRFYASASAEEIMEVMQKEFREKIQSLDADIKASGHALGEIITMASIIEKEVRTPRDKALVSGILWKRIAQNMPLQVDATLFYITGKASHELETEDLESKSPYNTYEHKGLPPTPISNPGLESIKAATRPEASPYFFYLSGKDGTTHYARTFDEHKKNKALYLK